MDVYSEKSIWKLQEEFTWLKDECYVDYAGAGLYSQRQLFNTTQDLCGNLYGNPHSMSAASKLSTDVIDQIRFRILELFHTDSSEYSVIFTSSATHGIKLVIENFAWDQRHRNMDGLPARSTYAYTAVNHTSIVGGRILAQDNGANIICIPEDVLKPILGNRGKCIDCPSAPNSLFAYPAMCNFSGKKYPLDWIRQVQNGAMNSLTNDQATWFCLLDAAAYCSTNDLNLSAVSPDFVVVSFYKLFGYPTGLGALLVKNSSAYCLNKKYFGGGAVDVSLPSGRFYKLRSSLHERFEDGTLPFLTIIALGHALDTLPRLGLTRKQISLHTFLLAQRLVQGLRDLRHWNGSNMAEIYSDTEFNDVTTQGGIVAFNLKRSNGSYIGFIEVLHVANLHKIHLRTGCFCNVGACQKYLNLTDEDLESHFQAGHICGDERDLVLGRPTGAVRISFGYPSTYRDVEKLLNVFKDSFVEGKPVAADSDIVLLRSHMPRLKSIRLYPVKSCGAMQVSTWRLNSRGLDYDRQWMVVTSGGVCLTQKQEPKLCQVLPNVDPSTGTLTLSFSGKDPITVPNPGNNNASIDMCTNKVCGDRVQGEDCGGEVGSWLSEHLERGGLRLVRQWPEDGRKSKVRANQGHVEEQASLLSLANQGQYLLVNASSVEWLQRRVADEPNFNCDTLVDRFRANLIVSGIKELEEQEWAEIQIGHVQLKVDGQCTRCQMICIDQQTGEKNRKPLVELSRALEGKLRFGIYCSHVAVAEDAVLSVNDPVVVHKRLS